MWRRLLLLCLRGFGLRGFGGCTDAGLLLGEEGNPREGEGADVGGEALCVCTGQGV